MNTKEIATSGAAGTSGEVGDRPLGALIGAHPLLKGMRPEHLQILTECAMQTRFEPGEWIFREGDVANRFYLILEGEVALESCVKDRGTIFVQAVGAGEVLGWSWLFPPYYWHFDARAVKPTKAIFLYGTRLRERCEGDHDLGYELMKRMADVIIKRLQTTRRQLLDGYDSHRSF